MKEKFFEKHETLIAIGLIVIYVLSNSFCMQNFGSTDFRSTIVNAVFSTSIPFILEIDVDNSNDFFKC